MAWDPTHTACLDAIKRVDGTPCDPVSCTAFAQQHGGPMQGFIHAICNCLPPYENGCRPVRTPGCCVQASAPIPILNPDLQCYCCCNDLLTTVAIAYDALAYKPITEYQVG